MQFSIQIAYGALLLLASLAAHSAFRSETRPKASVILTLVFAAAAGAAAAYGYFEWDARIARGGLQFGPQWVADNTAHAWRYPLAYGGLLLPPVAVALWAARGDGSEASSDEPEWVARGSRRERRAYYAWLIHGALWAFIAVVALALNWAEAY